MAADYQTIFSEEDTSLESYKDGHAWRISSDTGRVQLYGNEAVDVAVQILKHSKLHWSDVKLMKEIIEDYED
jgi:hypothetical protein